MNPRKRRLKRQARKARSGLRRARASRYLAIDFGSDMGSVIFTVGALDTSWLSDPIYDLIGLN